MEPEQKPSFTAAFQAVATPKEMTGLAYAEGYLNSIHIKGEGAGAALSQKKEREKDHASYMTGIIIHKYDEVTQAADQAMNDLERALNQSKKQLAAYEREIESRTITLADGTAVYYNTQTGLFEEQQEDGTWRTLHQDAQEEAFLLAEENGGMAASRQAKDFAEDVNEKHENIETSIGTMKLELTEIDKAVDAGEISPDEGAVLKEDILTEAETTQTEIDEAMLYHKDMPAVAVQVERPPGALFEQDRPPEGPTTSFVAKSTASAFGDPAYQSALRDTFQNAATREDTVIVPFDQEPSAPTAPLPNNGGAITPPRL